MRIFLHSGYFFNYYLDDNGKEIDGTYISEFNANKVAAELKIFFKEGREGYLTPITGFYMFYINKEEK